MGGYFPTLTVTSLDCYLRGRGRGMSPALASLERGEWLPTPSSLPAMRRGVPSSLGVWQSQGVWQGVKGMLAMPII